jgi:hypothetical protein
MWLPRDLDQLLNALPSAQETTYLDFKAILPTKDKNLEIAIDVAAMSSDGGVLIYGVSENRSGIFSKNPLDISGQSERIVSVVGANVGGSLNIEVFPIMETDPAFVDKGYLVVHVPASPVAPHHVEGSGFWGRTDKGNKRLTQGDIDRLYARRQEWETTASQHLDLARKACTFAPHLKETSGMFHLVVRPLFGSNSIRESFLPSDDGVPIIQKFFEIMNLLEFSTNTALSPRSFARDVTLRTLRGIRLIESPDNSSWVHLEFEFMNDGTLRLACGSIVDGDSHTIQRFVRDAGIAQMSAYVLAFAGQVYQTVKYLGQVDIFASIEGAEGCISNTWNTDRFSLASFIVPGRIQEGELQLTHRCLADSLAGPQILATVETLYRPLLRMLRQPQWPDPLKVVRN